jgi:micrococcal nuclease
MKRLFLTLLLLSGFALADYYPVDRVVDGDTIRVIIAGESVPVRLLGIDTPETVHPRLPVQPFGPEATAFVREVTTGQTVVLEADITDRDRYRRLLRDVYLEDGRHLNLLVVQEGLATTLTVPPNVAYTDVLRAALAGARSVHKGMWHDWPEPFADRNCSDFPTQDQAQAFFGGAQPGDPHKLDRNGNGVACDVLTHGRGR